MGIVYGLLVLAIGSGLYLIADHIINKSSLSKEDSKPSFKEYNDCANSIIKPHVDALANIISVNIDELISKYKQYVYIDEHGKKRLHKFRQDCDQFTLTKLMPVLKNERQNVILSFNEKYPDFENNSKLLKLLDDRIIILCRDEIDSKVEFYIEHNALDNFTIKQMQPINERSSVEADLIKCPKCKSTQITANKKGFGVGKAVVGVALTGGIGALGGFIGSNKVVITCLKCGNQWKP